MAPSQKRAKPEKLNFALVVKPCTVWKFWGCTRVGPFKTLWVSPAGNFTPVTQILWYTDNFDISTGRFGCFDVLAATRLKMDKSAILSRLLYHKFCPDESFCYTILVSSSLALGWARRLFCLWILLWEVGCLPRGPFPSLSSLIVQTWCLGIQWECFSAFPGPWSLLAFPRRWPWGLLLCLLFRWSRSNRWTWWSPPLVVSCRQSY